ncbi:MAG: hypothetical protein CMB93_03655 [Flammeovirgaceae bacterium]|nr:hypothetical protein [Flammeovirgaceae bacterium]
MIIAFKFRSFQKAQTIFSAFFKLWYPSWDQFQSNNNQNSLSKRFIDLISVVFVKPFIKLKLLEI